MRIARRGKSPFFALAAFAMKTIAALIPAKPFKKTGRHRMTMLSKSKLIPLLIENGYIENDKKVGFEAFGRTVLAFVHVKDMEARAKLERFLTGLKQKISPTYSPGYPVVQVQVSY